MRRSLSMVGRRFGRKARLALIVATLLRGGVGHSAPIDPAGVSDLLWPLIILAAPYVLVQDELSGNAADRRAREKWRNEAGSPGALMVSRVPVHGLYGGRLPLKNAIAGIMGRRGIPLVEIDAASAGWLLEQAADKGRLLELAGQHPYLRLTVADRGEASCMALPDRDDWTRQPPFPPGRCLSVAFVDSLASDVEITVDHSRRSERLLQWQLRNRTTQAVLAAVPFWNPQPNDGRVAFRVDYDRTVDLRENPFARLVSLLEPPPLAVETAGIPRVLRWTGREAFLHAELMRPPPKIVLPLTPAEGWTRPAKREFKGWEQAVAVAYEDGKPLLVGESLLILPQDHRVADLYWRHRGPTAVGRDLVYTARDSGLDLYVASVWTDGRPYWNAILQFAALPPELDCTKQYSCRVHVLDVAPDNEEIIITLSFIDRSGRHTPPYQVRVALEPLQASTGPADACDLGPLTKFAFDDESVSIRFPSYVRRMIFVGNETYVVRDGRVLKSTPTASPAGRTDAGPELKLKKGELARFPRGEYTHCSIRVVMEADRRGLAVESSFERPGLPVRSERSFLSLE